MGAGKNIEEERWEAGESSVAVVMISLNEGHNIEAVCQKFKGWAHSVFLVDSYSKTKQLKYSFAQQGFMLCSGNLEILVTSGILLSVNYQSRMNWTMKLDRNERLSDELKANILSAIQADSCIGIEFVRRWWFMGRSLSIYDKVTRVWKTGSCRFSEDSVNEHQIIDDMPLLVPGEMEHHDSPDLDHWLEKQNRYTTAEAIRKYRNEKLAVPPKLIGSVKQRRMWLRNISSRSRFVTHYYFYYWLWRGLWKSGRQGYIGARLWTDVMRLREYKWREMQITSEPIKRLWPRTA